MVEKASKGTSYQKIMLYFVLEYTLCISLLINIDEDNHKFRIPYINTGIELNGTSYFCRRYFSPPGQTDLHAKINNLNAECTQTRTRLSSILCNSIRDIPNVQLTREIN